MKLKQGIEKMLVAANHSRGNGQTYTLGRGLTIAVQIRWGEDFVRLVLMRQAVKPSQLELDTVINHWPYPVEGVDLPVHSTRIKINEHNKRTVYQYFTTRVKMDLNLIPILED